MPSSYLKLEQIFKEISILKTNLSILDWDKNTYMPVDASTERSEQISTISNIVYEKISNPNLQILINDIDIKELNNWQLQNLKLMQKEIKVTSLIPSKLITNLSTLKTKTSIAWKKAREENNFALVQDNLDDLLYHIRSYAQIKSDVIETSPYEALLDEYEPGLKIKPVDKIMDSLKTFVDSIIKKLCVKSPYSIEFQYNIDKQTALINFVLKSLGFNFNNGRIDPSSYAFCGGSPSDIRLAIYYDYKDFTRSLYGAMHEAGHASYNRNLPQKWLYQPVGNSVSTSIHESQALIYENHIGKNINFIKFLYPYLKEFFNSKISFDDEFLYKHINCIRPSLIRVDADEITYHAHIFIRYKIERALINNEISAKDIPDTWNSYYKEILGVTPKNIKEGCLQDIHWFIGYFGYFPTYTIGAIIAAQIIHHAYIDIKNLGEKFNLGQFSDLHNFLNQTIHSHGSLFPDSSSIIKNSFNEGIDTKYFKNYVQNKYNL